MLEFVPPHFSSSYWWEAIIDRTKGDGGPVVVESVNADDEVLLNLSYVAETVFWAPRGTCKMKNPKMKIEIQSLEIIRIALMFVQPTFDAFIFTT